MTNRSTTQLPPEMSELIKKMTAHIEESTQRTKAAEGAFVYFTSDILPWQVASLELGIWSNPKVAAAHRIPAGYFVLVIDGKRLRLPYMERGVSQIRTWAEIEDEFEQVFAPILRRPVDSAREHITALPARYWVTVGGADGADLVPVEANTSIDPRCVEDVETLREMVGALQAERMGLDYALEGLKVSHPDAYEQFLEDLSK